MNKSNTTIEQKRRAFLMDFHIPVQKAAVLVVGPISVAVFLAGAIAEPCWQNWVRLIAISTMAISWVVGFHYSRNKDLEVSVKIGLSSILLFQSVELLVVTGTEASTLIGLLATTCYAALFSKRMLYITGVVVFMAVVVSEFVKWSGVYPVLELSPTMRLFNQLIFTALLYSLAIFILRKSQNINEALFSSVAESNKEQKGIIETAGRIKSTVDAVTDQFKGLSSNFASQASEQAATTTEVKTTMESVMTIAGDTAALAAETNSNSKSTQNDSMVARRQLLEVENGFEELSETVIEASMTMNTLASQATSIGDILTYNKAIGDRIKILAVNAGIEAAKAGRHGAGFQVVAQELRGMIRSTEGNLQKSREILWAVRSQANDGAKLTSKSAELLSAQLGQLRSTGELVGKIIDSFVDASKNVSKISDGAQRQSASIGEINSALEQLRIAAGHLEGSGMVLLEGLNKIARTQQELGDVLGTKG